MTFTRHRLLLASTTAIALLLAVSQSVSALDSLTLRKDDPRLKPARVMIADNNGYRQIVIDGYIHDSTVQQFEEHSDLTGHHSGIVYFNSAGGDLDAAIALGRLIRQSNYATRVADLNEFTGVVDKGVCESACPVAFAGGRYRFIDQDIELGVHQFYRAAKGSWSEQARMTVKANERLRSYLAEMGIHADLAEVIRTVPADRMRHIPMKEAHLLGLINAGVEASRWEATPGQVFGSQYTAKGATEVTLTCSSSEGLNAEFAVRPWIDATSLLGFENHHVLTDTHPHMVSDAEVGYRKEDGFLTIKVHLSPAIAEKAKSATGIGYQFSSADGRSTKRFEVDSLKGQQAISELVKTCKLIAIH